ncbi:MAG TPA: Ig-like domain-containing protein [Kofleriaceae bacterium]|nr:Ig-like domain-containing protein [Kofleriaceae bacterium]
MFVKPMRLKTQGAVAIASLALAACDDPTARTDLRPEGPPEVLAVLVLNDSVGGLVESPTYCKPNDNKRPGLVGLPDFTTVQICPADLSEVPMLTDASPGTFYVRIMFDELLDPKIETLEPIIDDDGQPTGQFEGSIDVTKHLSLQCTGVDGTLRDVPATGYYSPSGNNVTWPLGPALVIKQSGTFVVPTNSECQITLKESITDKSGEPVPPAQRGPYRFKVAPVQAIEINPSNDAKVDALAINRDGVYVHFNTAVDPDSFCDEGAAMDQCEFRFSPDLGAPVATPLSDTEFSFGAANVAAVDTRYTFEFTGGKVKDLCGIESTLSAGTVAGNTKTSFTTNPWKLNSTNPAPGDTVPANRKVRLNFSNLVAVASLDPTEFTITPPIANPLLSTTTGGDIILLGDYAANTEYTFTLNAGATVSDRNGATLTNAAARTVTFKTQPLALTAVAPANGATVTKATPTAATAITLTFNQSMDITSFTADDFTVSPAAPTLTITKAATTDCTATSTACRLRISGVYTPGTYTFTLKAGAVLTDVFGAQYTQATDRVVTFTVADAKPAPAAIPCLGE